MTIKQEIDLINNIKPNQYSEDMIIRWLSTLDGILKKEIIDTHEGAEEIIFTGYDEDTDTATELLVAAPYDDIYKYFIEKEIDYANNEYGKYNNSVSLYNNAYSAFQNHYNSTVMPLKKTKVTLF